MVRTIGNVQKDAQVRAVASGALANGDTVIVNADGTVSVAGLDSQTQYVGSPTTFETDQSEIYPHSAVFDASTNKVVIAYRNNTTSYGEVVVGTASSSSISFGTPVVFKSATTEFTSCAYDANAEKVVIAYETSSSDGEAVVGTVSGTSISFGTPVVFDSGVIQYTAIAYDSVSQKVVIAYCDKNIADGAAIVGTVSGTSISFGSQTSFDSNNINVPSIVYDTNAQKIVVAYSRNDANDYGYAAVGTVSGTSISFGTSVAFDSDGVITDTDLVYDINVQKVVVVYKNSTTTGRAKVGTVSGTSISFGSATTFSGGNLNEPTASYDANAQKVVVAYRDRTVTPNAGKVTVGTVSGTSISFTTPTQYEAGESNFNPSTYDSNVKRVIIAYRDDGDSENSKALVYRTAYSRTNLTSENFVGFSNSGYASGQSAAINSTCSVDRSQTSLTAGQTYYVQTDGSLGLTAADPSVEAGTAISATEILVKG